jgi:hypothetical protein
LLIEYKSERCDGIGKLYGCSTVVLGEIAGGAFVVPCRELLKYGKRQISVIGPVLEAQGAAIHRNFWKSNE